MNDDMDELDRALFALPLAAPPADLRASIFNATVFAGSRTAPSIARPWEAWASGIAFAVAAWLCYAIVAYKGFGAAFNANLGVAIRAFGDPSTFVWFALGCVVTAAIWFATDSNLRLPFRGVRQ